MPAAACGHRAMFRHPATGRGRFTLVDYVEAGILSGARAALLRTAVRDRKNILAAGGTSTGAPTMACHSPVPTPCSRNSASRKSKMAFGS